VSYRKAIAIRDNYPEAYNGMGVVLLKMIGTPQKLIQIDGEVSTKLLQSHHSSFFGSSFRHGSPFRQRLKLNRSRITGKCQAGPRRRSKTPAKYHRETTATAPRFHEFRQPADNLLEQRITVRPASVGLTRLRHRPTISVSPRKSRDV
jgi:hypothetical protein